MSGATDDRTESRGGFTKTVTLSDRDIRIAARLLTRLVGNEDDRGRELTTLAGKFGSDPNSVEDRLVLVERARQTYVNRALRARIFNSKMFGEAAWDMLLALYVTDQSSARHTVSGLVALSGVPPTTALRWLDYLETEEQLVTRSPNPLDARVFRIELTDKARELLDTYFSGLDTAGA